MRVWLTLFLLPLVTSKKVDVPGCPDIDSLENETNIDQNTLNNLLLCFCKVEGKDSVAISCLYGSNPDHLKRASDAVMKANMTTHQISIQHMDFPETGVPALAAVAPHLRSLDIRECGSSDSLAIADDVFKGIEETLQNLTIHGCSLKEIPSPISSLKSLRNLDLSSNKLEAITASIFANKKQLTYLDLSTNDITQAEEGSFEPLTQLETLVIGDRNFMNETVLDEIGKLTGLKTLDLSRADGIFEPPARIFPTLSSLELLKLSGCSIPVLEAGAFAPLKSLKQLDLRVNLIENISAYAFDGLSNLERLTLAGNYIRNVDKDVWVGLSSLHDLDLGWNEIKDLTPDSLQSLAGSLTSLSLKHNPITDFPSSGLNKLENLTLGECESLQLTKDSFKDYTMLKSLDLSRCNLTKLPEGIFRGQKESLIKLNLDKNFLRYFDGKTLKDLPALQELDISMNPFLCDGQMADFVFAVEDRYKDAAKNGKEFLLTNSNDTLCDRPYALRYEPLLSLDSQQLQPYDESQDTTTVPTTTTTEATDEDATMPTLLPAVFSIGGNTNDTLLKEEPRREAYELGKYDNSKAGSTEHDPSTAYIWPITIGVIVVISIITLVAVALFMRKQRKVTTTAQNGKKAAGTSIEDGMVEIELNTQPPKQK